MSPIPAPTPGAGDARTAPTSTALVDTLLQTAPYGMIVLDPEDAVLVVNRHAEMLLGRRSVSTAEDLAGLALPEHRDRIRARIRAAREEDPRTRAMSSPVEAVLVRPDGREVDVEMTVMPVDSVTGRMVSLALADVSERRSLERALEEKNRDLQHFTSLASHDLQEPLRTIVSYCELLEAHAGAGFDERAKRYVRHASGGAKRLQVLLDGLLEYARLGRASLVVQRTDPRPIVEDALAGLSAQIQESGVSVTTGDLPDLVEADAVLLRQLFQNLVGNALKFRTAASPRIEIFGRSRPRGVEFTVRDNGIGIPPGEEERIFDMFRRLHTAREYPGSGIGLAFARRIVESHGGRIWAASRPEGGASFHFTIPRST